MTNVQNVNKEFSRIVRSIRWFMPYLAVGLLLFVYGVAAWAEGYFIARLMAAEALAYCIGAAAQVTRGTLVFFPQLNPTRPTLSLRGELIAVGMGLISVASIVGLVESAGLPVPVAVSLAILMLAGVGVELFLLREIKFATHMELFRNREWWTEIQSYHLAEKQLGVFLDRLRDAEEEELGKLSLTLPVAVSMLPSPAVAQAPIPVEAPAPAPQAVRAAADPDEELRDRYLRAARNNLRSAIELEGENAHEEAAKDYELADEYIRLAYPSAAPAQLERQRDRLIGELGNERPAAGRQGPAEPAGALAHNGELSLDLSGNGRLYP